MKRSLMEKIGIQLLQRSYTVKTLTRSCFDVIARKASRILLVKVLHDANAISQEYASEMLRLSSYLSAAPVIVAEKAGAYLENSVVYARFGVYVLNLPTFASALDNRLPFIISTHAGLSVSVAGKLLQQARQEDGYSAGALSQKIGVSKSMIRRYEQDSDVSLSKAQLLYAEFGSGVFKKINVFAAREAESSKPGSPIVEKYGTLGFDATEAKNAPFDVVARREKEIIFTEVGDRTNPHLESLTRLIRAENLIIFRTKKPKNMPSMTKQEFMEFENAEDLIRFLREFECGS